MSKAKLERQRQEDKEFKASLSYIGKGHFGNEVLGLKQRSRELHKVRIHFFCICALSKTCTE